MMTKNHFQTLGIKPGCSEDEVKKAYRSLAKKFHPDKNSEAGAEEKFKEISAAYEVLKNEDRRCIHEREVLRQTTTSNTTNGYTQSYKSETKNNQYNESAWSRKFGESSRKFEEHARNFEEHSKKYNDQENRYKKSTFGRFTDEGKGSYKEAHGKHSNKKTNEKPKKKQSTNHRPRRPWSSEWTAQDDTDTFYDIPDPGPQKANFSFAFKSFVDDLGMSFDAFFTGPEVPNGTFGFSAFFDTPDPFTEFSRFSSPTSFNTQNTRRPPRKRNVANERGAEDLDPEYLFTSRDSRPQTRHSSCTKGSYFTDFNQTSTNFDDDDDDDDMDSRLFKCTYCHKRMPFSQLSVHEPGCALRHGGRFDVSDEEEDPTRTDHDPNDIYNGFGSPDEDQYPQKTGDWRQTHEELLKNIRKAKKAAQSTQRRYNSATTATTKDTKETKDDGIAQIKCKWCGRTFSHPAAKHHIPFCEKWTKDHGTPLNPAGKQANSDIGSKNQKAKDYAKHIPKPRNVSSEDYESETPRSARNPFDNYPHVGVHNKRETMNKAGVASGTGLHASFSKRDKSSSPGPSYSSTGSHTQRSRTSSRANIGTSKYVPNFGENHSGPSFTIPVDDSYGFGLSGTKIKTETRTSDGCCPVCRKKYGVHGRFLCNCGVRKTGC
ncbi:DnaJ (Hsp40) [Mactra antiquata]